MVISTKILLIYLLLVNIITFAVRGYDKKQARKEKQRISEKKLLSLVAVGGSIGAFSGSSLFRHKTIKGSFLWKLYTIVTIQIIILFIYFSYI